MSIAAQPTTGATAVEVWTLLLAGCAVLATLFSAVLLRRTGKASVRAAEKAASASEGSAQAAEKSAQAAQDSVGVNRETAVGVAQRAVADALAKRYQDAANQLGHDKAPVRLAGAYAMARLADDWPEERQACVDVLCAYLRMSWESVDRFDEAEPPAPPETQVRQTIINLIARHVRDDAAISWSSLSFDLKSAKLPRLVLDHAIFYERLVLEEAQFLDAVCIRGSTFSSGATFRAAHFMDGVEFLDCNFRGSTDFAEAVFPLHTTSRFVINRLAPDASLRFEGHLTGKVAMTLNASSGPQGEIILGKLFGVGVQDPLRITPSRALTVGNSEPHYPIVIRYRQPDDYGRTIEVDDPIEVRDLTS